MIKLFLISKKITPRGFTLLETLVSIFILTLVIVGPLGFMVTSSSYAKQTKEALIATYLAEEGFELVQNHYDSLYIYCKKQPNVSPCVTSTGETTGEVAWRLFKERFLLGSIGFPSCEIPSGCVFDIFDVVTASITATTTRYTPSSTSCPSLVGVSSSSRYSYVCKGVPSHISGDTEAHVTYVRTIDMEHLPTFDTDAKYEQDNDDMRVKVNVTYKASNGRKGTISIVRFIHPRL